MNLTPGTRQSWLHRSRERLDQTLAARGLSHTFSLARYRLHRALVRILPEFTSGECLDAGSGLAPYRRMMLELGARVTTLDIQSRGTPVDVIGDIQNMPAIADESINTILCTQVLEHVPRPWEAFHEFVRVLKQQGILIVTVPHLSAIHEAPHDYYRYTPYGLRALCESHGLEVLVLESTGGLFCFLGHGGSWLLLSALGALPVLRWPVWLLNYVLGVHLMGVVDNILGMKGRYPCDHILVARKRIAHVS